MKFGVKLILYIIVIIACILSISRYCIIRQSFNYSLNKSIEESINRYIAQKYYLESNIIKNIEAGEKIAIALDEEGNVYNRRRLNNRSKITIFIYRGNNRKNNTIW